VTQTSSSVLKRYTSLTAAIDMLVHERITLLSPSSWEDKNDIAFMDAYRQKRGIPKVFAACFTQASETFHHWGVFANGNEGVRISINKPEFLRSLVGQHCYLWNDVSYKTLDQLADLKTLSVYELPFLKRFAFKDELEFRLICESTDPYAAFHHVPLRREWITSIALSPWLPTNLVDTMKEVLPKLPGCSNVRVIRTNIRDHQKWQAAIGRVADESDEGLRPQPL